MTDEQKLINNIIEGRKMGETHIIISERVSAILSYGSSYRGCYRESRHVLLSLGHMQRGGSPTCKDRVCIHDGCWR